MLKKKKKSSSCLSFFNVCERICMMKDWCCFFGMFCFSPFIFLGGFVLSVLGKFVSFLFYSLFYFYLFWINIIMGYLEWLVRSHTFWNLLQAQELVFSSHLKNLVIYFSSVVEIRMKWNKLKVLWCGDLGKNFKFWCLDLYKSWLRDYWYPSTLANIIFDQNFHLKMPLSHFYLWKESHS